jgi:hypothetical protein
VFGLPHETLDEMLARVDAVGADEVAELATELYAREALSAACVGADEARFRRAVESVSAQLAAA